MRNILGITIIKIKKKDIESKLTKFYDDNIDTLYSNTNTFLHDDIKIDYQAYLDFIYYPSEVNGAPYDLLCDDEDTNKSATAINEELLMRKYNTLELCAVQIIDNISVLKLFQTDSFIKDIIVRMLNINNLSLGNDYIIRLETIIEDFKLHEKIIAYSSFEIRQWKDLILSQTELLLKILYKEESIHSNIYKTFILKSMFDAMDIQAADTNKMKFIAEIIGTTEQAVSDSLKKINKKSFGSTNTDTKQFIRKMESAIETSNFLLYDKKGGKTNEIVKKMIDNMSFKLKNDIEENKENISNE